MSAPPLVSIIIVSWNSRADLADCLASVAAQRYAPTEIIVVDNASEDGSAELVTTRFPNATLIQNDINVGFAAAVNQGFAAARGDILVELNPDTVVDSGWLEPLVTAAQRPNVGLVNPRILLRDEPERINACGNVVSLTGLTYCIGLGESAEQYAIPSTRPIPAISGAAFAITRRCYEATGGLDDDYFTYFEDTDLSWRARLAGFEMVLAADAVIYHRYRFDMTPQKLYYIERNRLMTLFACLEPRTLLLLSPALVLGELIAWGFALLRGGRFVAAKWRSLTWLLRHRPQIQHKRNQIKRVVSDRTLVAQMTTNLPFAQSLPAFVAIPLARLCRPLLRLNRWLIVGRGSRQPQAPAVVNG